MLETITMTNDPDPYSLFYPTSIGRVKELRRGAYDIGLVWG